jgi:pimeloyl-ACP methyl ester carboxylesterase
MSVHSGSSAATHIAVAGADHHDTVVLLPGRHANAAVSTPLVTALAQRYRVVVVDLPGEAGLSSGGRPNTARLREYGTWLSELLPQLADRPVHLLGHAFGAAVALAATPSPRVAGLVLMNPAGLAWPALNPGLLAAGARWRLYSTQRSSRRLLTHLWGSGAGAPDDLGEWMQRRCRNLVEVQALARVLVACSSSRTVTPR